MYGHSELVLVVGLRTRLHLNFSLWTKVDSKRGRRRCYCATPEPAGLDRSDNRRPDVLITLDNHMYIIDVSIVHPTCITHLRQHSHGATATREREKRYKYTAMGEQHGFMFVPFVMYTLGGLGDGARQLYHILMNATHSHIGPWSTYDVVAGLRDAAAVVIQSNNNGIIQAAWSRAGARMTNQ